VPGNPALKVTELSFRPDVIVPPEIDHE